MKRKILVKMAIDLIMATLMLTAMINRFTGNTIHELLGVSIFVLFIVHNILNWHWYPNVLKGKYNVRRILNLIVNLLLLVTIVALIASSVSISRTVFAGLSIQSGLVERQIHTLAAYVGFILASIHVGMHWKMIIKVAQRMMGNVHTNHLCMIVLRLVAGLIAIYGVYASFDRDVGSKLILYHTYESYNYDEPAISFFIKYLAIMGTYIYGTYYVLKFVQKKKAQTTGEQRR